MGVGKSAYEKRTVRCFYKLSPSESKMIKTAWREIDTNLQYHATGFITKFCEKYPLYVFYFTNEPRHPLNIDVNMTSTASVVLESMSYFFLNYYDKTSKFNRLVGYLAMFHKDMGLDENDIKNFMDYLLEYIVKTNPAPLNVKCYKAFKKYLHCIQEEMSSRMEEYLEIDDIYMNDPSRLKSRCVLFEKKIYGFPLSFWGNRKEMWTQRLRHWNKEIRILHPSLIINKEEQKKKDEFEQAKLLISDPSLRRFVHNKGSLISNCEVVNMKNQITENFITGANNSIKNDEDHQKPSLNKNSEEKNNLDNQQNKSSKYWNEARRRRRERLSG